MKPAKNIALSLVLACSILTACGGYRYVATPPAEPAYTQTPAPYPGAVWVSGEWAWQNGHHQYVPGYWARPRNNKVYISGKWEQRPNGYYWMRGHWK